ncbi:MAG TPA: ROK family protein [Leptospiraceae bacterium]|nr:ROK family protein [Leptospiraceae bacterium]HMW05909.1 ROK family protein [Leptospiraceae bacterium]HMX32687.1 ROK family protein [Leptospiraceae bacterium]HMY32726.1 ROK family protein [Leptospiraceae bacterium]HMZ62533.1 ROK family protein [Leptospiraceae bacterium]
MKKYLGIDVGGGSIRGTVVDKEGNSYFDFSVPTNPDSYNQEFLESVQTVVKKCISAYEVNGIGIGTPGPIDIDSGVIISSANLKNLSNVELTSFIRKEFHLPVFFNNDANCASLGEYYFGAGKGSKSLIVFTLGTGLGCGWVLNGKVFNGFKGNGMEAGHITVVQNGALCGCGQRGCVEAYFSTKGFIGRYKDRTSIEIPNSKVFFEKVAAKEKEAMEVLDFGVTAFAEGIRNVVHLVNPDRIVFVGGITASYSLFGKVLEEKAKQIMFPVLSNYIEFKVGSSLAGSYGAAALAFE